MGLELETLCEMFPLVEPGEIAARLLRESEDELR